MKAPWLPLDWANEFPPCELAFPTDFEATPVVFLFCDALDIFMLFDYI